MLVCCPERCVSLPMLLLNFARHYRWGARVYLSSLEVEGCCNGLSANKNATCASECLEVGCRNWDFCMATSAFEPAGVSVSLSVNTCFSIPVLQLEMLVFHGNVLKQKVLWCSSVSLLMLQYVTPNQSFKCVASYPCVKLAAQQLSIMETQGKSSNSNKVFWSLHVTTLAQWQLQGKRLLTILNLILEVSAAWKTCSRLQKSISFYKLIFKFSFHKVLGGLRSRETALV